MPSLRESLPFAADKPMARFHENEKPNFLDFPIEVSNYVSIRASHELVLTTRL